MRTPLSKFFPSLSRPSNSFVSDYADRKKINLTIFNQVKRLSGEVMRTESKKKGDFSNTEY